MKARGWPANDIRAAKLQDNDFKRNKYNNKCR